MLSSDLAIKKKGRTAVAKISLNEPPYLQSLAAKVSNLESDRKVFDGRKNQWHSIQFGITYLIPKMVVLYAL